MKPERVGARREPARRQRPVVVLLLLKLLLATRGRPAGGGRRLGARLRATGARVRPLRRRPPAKPVHLERVPVPVGVAGRRGARVGARPARVGALGQRARVPSGLVRRLQ